MVILVSLFSGSLWPFRVVQFVVVIDVGFSRVVQPFGARDSDDEIGFRITKSIVWASAHILWLLPSYYSFVSHPLLVRKLALVLCPST